ncbi:hypothetical protein EDC04DRAFT_2603269 [Pisolithus marmoratus]|nr:hypothetical protein EDC04DRAFT_2603269 [Pisolithus marmoratus]
MDGGRERGNGHQHLDWRRGGGNYLEGGLGWWFLVLEELDGRRDERGRAREGGAYPPVIADVAVLEPHLVEVQQCREVGGGAKEMQLSSHDQWPLQHFNKSKCES